MRYTVTVLLVTASALFLMAVATLINGQPRTCIGLDVLAIGLALFAVALNLLSGRATRRREREWDAYTAALETVPERQDAQ